MNPGVLEALSVAMVGLLPLPGEEPVGGVETATSALVTELRRRGDVDLTLVVCSARVRERSVQTLDGIRAIYVPQGPGFLGWFRAFHVDVRRELKRIDADVVHVQGFGSIAFTTPRAILTVHGTLHKDNWHNRIGVKRVVSSGGALLMEGIPNYLTKRRIVLDPRSRGTYIPNALNKAFIQSGEGVREPNRVVAVGALSPLKNTAGLIRAFAEVHRQNPYAELVIIGSGSASYTEECAAIISDAGLGGAVTLRGNQPPDEVAREMRSAQVLAHFSNRENAPMVAVEALASGCSLVITDVGAVRSMVEDAAGVRIVSPGDESQLARELVAALAERGHGGQPHSAILAPHMPEAVAEATVREYRRVAAETGRR